MKMYEGDIYSGEGVPEKLMRYDSLSFSLHHARIIHVRDAKSNCGWITPTKKRNWRTDEMGQEKRKKGRVIAKKWGPK